MRAYPGSPKPRGQLLVASYRPQPDASVSEDDGKFVLLTKGKVLHLVLSPVSLTPFHANIVYQYLQVEGRGEVEAVSSSGCRILTKGWKVHGGGYYAVQHWLHAIVFSGKSTAFGKFDQNMLEPFLTEIPEKMALPHFTFEMK